MVENEKDGLPPKHHLGFIEWREFEGFCTTDEVVELQKIGHEVREEPDVEPAESRSVDSGDEVFHVLTLSKERKRSESGKDSACRWRRTWLAVAKYRQLKSKTEEFEPRQ
jgi:hypothetical protein